MKDRAAEVAMERVDSLPVPALRGLARLVGATRPLALEPGWYFDKSETDARPTTGLRRAIWRRFERERLTAPVTLRWYDGLKLRLYLGNDLSKCLYIGGSFEPNEFVFLDGVIEEGMTVIDAGANEGVYTLFAARRVGRRGRVVAFEPSARERRRLEDNIRINHLTNIEVRGSALGESAGDATLAIADYGHEGQNTIGEDVANPNVATKERVAVPVERLDDVVASGRFERVDVIKVDVEGSEVAFLRGATETIRRFRPLLQLEVEEGALATQGTSKEELRDMLGSFDYALYVFDSDTGDLRQPGSVEELTANVIAAPVGWRGRTSQFRPYLSVVATARNDNHGGDLLHRIQVFVNGLAAQAERFSLPLELVLVEWNPPSDRPPLAKVVDWPKPSQFFRARIVEVPVDRHRELTHSDRLPLFQMIAKNVGIRRAQAPFVLATNVDVLLSDELMARIARRDLRRGRFYRADRVDVDGQIDPFAPIEVQLEEATKSTIRICSLEGTRDLRSGEYYPIYGPMTSWPGPLARWGRLIRFGVPFVLRRARQGVVYVVRSASSGIILPSLRGRSLRRGIRLMTTPAGRTRIGAAVRRLLVPTMRSARAERTARIPIRQHIALFLAYAREKRQEIDEAWQREQARVRLHTNACGDFTLLSRQDWERLDGYAELQMFSMHLDSLLLYEAHYAGLRQTVLPGAVYHLEHGGGFKPDDDAVQTLNARLERDAIPQITYERFLEHIKDMYARRARLALNDDDWGFANLPLPEVDPTKKTREDVKS